MSDSTATTYEQACVEYQRLLREYGGALKAGSTNSMELLAQAEAAWQRIRAAAPKGAPEATASDGMHLVLAFSHAVGVGDAVEAERLYNAMSDEARKNTDEADSAAPGSVKIWTHSTSSKP
jgi:hypothetical protein